MHFWIMFLVNEAGSENESVCFYRECIKLPHLSFDLLTRFDCLIRFLTVRSGVKFPDLIRGR